MINTDPAYWNGCLWNESRNVRCGNLDRPDVPLRNWVSRAIPTYNQMTDDCVGHGWANMLEMLIREYVGMEAIPEGYQIDGHAVWVAIKELFYGGRLKGGAYLPEGFHALKALRWIPRDSVLVEVGID